MWSKDALFWKQRLINQGFWKKSKSCKRVFYFKTHFNPPLQRSLGVLGRGKGIKHEKLLSCLNSVVLRTSTVFVSVVPMLWSNSAYIHLLKHCLPRWLFHGPSWQPCVLSPSESLKLYLGYWRAKRKLLYKVHLSYTIER